MTKKRPKHLALHQIKLPLPGIVSILHRVSGALLFLALLPLLFLFQCSLESIETYTWLTGILGSLPVKLLLLLLLWSFLHHFCAGIRYLAIDLHIGSSLSGARTSSKLVVGVSLLLTILLGAKLW